MNGPKVNIFLRRLSLNELTLRKIIRNQINKEIDSA